MSNVMSLAWHEACLKNRKKSSTRELSIAMKALENAKKSIEEDHFYEKQIKEAKIRGKISFDSERFMIKKNKEKK